MKRSFFISCLSLLLLVIAAGDAPAQQQSGTRSPLTVRIGWAL